MTIFFTGCTHFNHANIIRLANRPFASVEEMNETLIERWNKTVKRSDTVYHLGDLGWLKDRTEATRLLNRLNGDKHLIKGNHDPQWLGSNQNWESVNTYSEVFTADANLVLFHYPIEEWGGFYKGTYHVHCHTHQSDPKGKVPIERRVNVTVEAWDYTPVSLEEVIQVWS